MTLHELAGRLRRATGSRLERSRVLALAWQLLCTWRFPGLLRETRAWKISPHWAVVDQDFDQNWSLMEKRNQKRMRAGTSQDVNSGPNASFSDAGQMWPKCPAWECGQTSWFHVVKGKTTFKRERNVPSGCFVIKLLQATMRLLNPFYSTFFSPLPLSKYKILYDRKT